MRGYLSNYIYERSGKVLKLACLKARTHPEKN